MSDLNHAGASAVSQSLSLSSCHFRSFTRSVLACAEQVMMLTNGPMVTVGAISLCSASLRLKNYTFSPEDLSFETVI